MTHAGERELNRWRSPAIPAALKRNTQWRSNGITGGSQGIKYSNWLCGLIVMPGETYLDGFAGSGAISEGIIRAGGRSYAIEREPAYAELIELRFAALDRG
ncbi:hypothetical protein [Cryobacterium tagatosivorans]|uniref:DNA methylase N-4/N-6 domain-containing protein n=1 Tax=Cryobacterium tagatosivorans TaxID=1259199 RepID=A0A4R8UC64_9MICO|nr:hypothetical protein [Cryobacterium tagatosivorans]TFB48914.1 hypothetical protein E3O23_12675 [Cryobacterium tagatosivorans]